jgi:hypothetical protein
LGLLLNVLLGPFTGPYYGVRFVLSKIRDQVETERENQEQALQEELVALNMRLEIGELSEEEFEAKEAAVLQSLREFRESRAAASR